MHRPLWLDALPASAIGSSHCIDRAMTLEIRPPSGGLPPGIVVPMYEVCRAHQGGPLSMAAASALRQHVRRGNTDAVVACANARLPAAALVKSPRVHPIEVESFPCGPAAGRTRTTEIMARHRPSAVVFVERDGPNLEGQFHGVRSDCRDPDGGGHVYLLAESAQAAGVLTIGIGDGGNEVGFGAMRAQITDILPRRGRSLAGHASGVVTAIATDITVSASVSNWGASAVVAALAVLLGDEAILHDPVTERDLIAAAVAGGARDGATSQQALRVDGIDCAAHMAFVEFLRAVARASIRPVQARTAQGD